MLHSEVQRLVRGLESPWEQTLKGSLARLAELVEGADVAAAATLGHFLRGAGAPARLLMLLPHADAYVQQATLLLLGNLSSNTVDPQSWRTKAELISLGGFGKLVPLLRAQASPGDDDEVTLLYALGAVQNLCTELRCATQLLDAATDARLRELCAVPALADYARGCLHNRDEVLRAHHAGDDGMAT